MNVTDVHKYSEPLILRIKPHKIVIDAIAFKFINTVLSTINDYTHIAMFTDTHTTAAWLNLAYVSKLKNKLTNMM